MIRVLVADDERPVVEGISHIVRKELALEFEIAGTASSGREAIERAVTLSPDLVLMDVRMPGISGLDAIREIRKRGSPSAFILITAYERFDIAREAVGLGVLDYLLKPVTKDSLATSLRSAALFIARKDEIESREIEYREREEGMRSFVEAAFVQGVMLGERSKAEIERYRAALGLRESLACAGAAAVQPPLCALDPAAEARSCYEGLRQTLRYKTRALVGPCVAGLVAFVLPLREESEAEEAKEELRLAVEASHASELVKGRLRLAFGSCVPFEDAVASWTEALSILAGGAGSGTAPDPAAPRSEGGWDFEEDEAFLEALLSPSTERARLSLEAMIAPLDPLAPPPAAAAYRFAALLGSALRALAVRGLVPRSEAAASMDFADLIGAGSGEALALALRARFATLSALSARTTMRSSPIAAAIESVKRNFSRPITLESVSDELGISSGRLSRLFIEGTGKGFSDFLIDYRIERAKEMLALPGAAVKQVSVACGYPDANYFSRLFKKATGLTPSAFSSLSGGGEP